jgi:glycosyltransferase involved in cell wall biosynthesis
VAKYRSRTLDSEVRRVVAGEAPAWVIAHSYHVAPAALEADRPLWVDFHNVDSVIWQRLSRSAPSPFVRLATRWQAPLVERYEDSLYRRAAGFSAVSDLDADTMRSRSPGMSPIVVPNGVDLERYAFRPDPPDDQILLFVGDLRWHPNADGVAWFAKSVWPILRTAAPEARVELLGRGATDALLRLADDRLTFIGGVPDTRPAWSRAAIGIVPLLTGGGTRLKILEGAAMGVPVVSTSVGAEGLDLTSDDAIVIRDQPTEWAAAIAELLADRERRRRMAAVARSQVEARYDWVAIGEAFARHLSDG